MSMSMSMSVPLAACLAVGSRFAIVSAVAHHHELIFPIVQNSPSKYVNGVPSLSVVGVGFFIHPDGAFATAKHVLGEFDPFENQWVPTDDLVAMEQTRNGEVRESAITEAWYHPNSDIAAGRLAGWPGGSADERRCLRVTTRVATPGETVFSYGFPESNLTGDLLTLSEVKERQVDLVATHPDLMAGAREQWREIRLSGTVYEGQVLEYLAEGTITSQGPGCSVTMPAPGGLSGGPVWTSDGVVIGVVSSSSKDLAETSVTGADTLLRLETSAAESVAEFLGERIVA